TRFSRDWSSDVCSSDLEASRFCSNCGAPLRGGAPAEGSSETTSTISISGLEAYEAEVTGQHQVPALPPEAQAAVDALPAGSALRSEERRVGKECRSRGT